MALGNVLKEFGVKLTLAFDKKKAADAQRAIAGLAKDMKSLALEVSGASATLLGFAAIASANGRELQQNADMLGINVERLQELEYAAKVAADVSRGELMGALEGVSATLDKARHSDVMAAESLIRLGIPIQMITDRTVTADQVMLSLADRLKGIQDPMAKARLAMEVFGGAGAKLLPLLNKGSAGIAEMGKEARSLGVILGKDSIDKAAEFDRQWSKIWIVLKNVSFLIGNELIKYLKPMADQFQRFVVQNRQFISLGIAAVMKSIGHYLEIVFRTLRFVIERFAGLVEVMGGVEKVSRMIAFALGVMTSVKIISGLGTLLTSFRAIFAVVGALNLSTLAVGAGFLALILVVQDLMSKDSIIKEWFNKLAEMVWEPVKAFDVWLDKIDEFVKKLGAVGEAIQTVTGLFPDSSSKDQPFMLRSGRKALNEDPTVAKIKAGMAQANRNIAYPGGAGALPPPEAGGIHIDVVDVDVSVPTGTTPSQATGMVAGGIEKGLGGVLRQTRNQAVGGRAY